jgi:hypothetical protein
MQQAIRSPTAIVRKRGDLANAGCGLQRERAPNGDATGHEAEGRSERLEV